MNTSKAGGAYGLRLLGPRGDHPSLPTAPEHWPSWSIRWSIGEAPAAVGPQDRFSVLGGGQVVVDVEAATISVYGAAEPSSEALMHPWLSFFATVVSQRRGLISFHGGGFVHHGSAWAMLGAKHAGKTSSLAWLSRHGCTVTSDDLVVLDGVTSLAGPGCLDLRQGAADYLGLGDRITLLPGRERWRVWLPVPPAETKFAGFVVPEWHDEVLIEAVPPRDRLQVIAQSRAYRALAGHERQILALSALPMLRWCRPRDFTRLHEASEALMAAIGSDAEAATG